ncbi:recombinase zinc beta ribbon domain-containing protein [Streptomyces sp. NPDC088925]|uniref:recombinase zinc beta ribbon domain-containing protein n=1 Tax=Streptomyces sp. NPDC088925 TaxID=3365914 RepID=UPI00381A9748
MSGRAFGWTDTTYSQLHAQEAPALAEAVEQRLSGRTRGEIAAWLKERGFTGAGGGEFVSSSIGAIFANPRLAGLVRDPDGNFVPTGLPAVTSPETWHRLQEIEAADLVPNGGTYEYLLVGLAECGNCHHLLVGGRDSRSKPIYRCVRKKGADNCGQVRLRASLLEEFVATQAVAELARPGNRDALVRAQERVRSELRRTRTSLGALVRRRRRLGEDANDGVISEEEYQAGLLEVRRQKALLAREEKVLQAAADVSLEESPEGWVRQWNHSSTARQAALCAALIARLEVNVQEEAHRRDLEPGRVVIHWRGMSTVTAS